LIFRKPKKVPAGWLIEQTGFKGKRFGDAGIQKNQALVLVNYGAATGQEILNVSRDIQRPFSKLLVFILRLMWI
jgi:UDP-N-acetylmuramate dehydrogenase